MKPEALLLLLGSLALWTGLPAAPTPRTSAQPPLSPSSAPGEAPQDEISQEEEAKLACVVDHEPQKSPLPWGRESGGHGEMEAGEPQPGKEGSLPPEAAGPADPEKLLCKENPQPERPPENNLEVESSGGPRPVEKPQEASESPLGGAPVSREKCLLGGNAAPKEKPSSLGRPKLAPNLPNLETWNPVWDPSNAATSAGKTNSSEKHTSSTPGDKAMPGMGKPTSTEELVPGSGHAIRDKLKPASAAGHLAHMGPTSGEKPAPNSGPEAHGKPVAGERPPSGEKPSSQEGHEKRPPADKPTSSEKPEDGAKPEAVKESKPEREAEEEEEEEEEEEGLFDEEEEGEKGKENEEGAPERNQDGEDAFDKELDYGLNNPPFDAYSYHDAWSDKGAKEAGLGLVGEMAAPPQAGDANNGGKPIFDAWGDLVGGSRP